MHALWNKDNIMEYHIDCGNFTFRIHTHLKNINVNSFDNITANTDLANYNIDIWIDKDYQEAYIEKFNKCMNYEINFIPDSIKNLYKHLDDNNLTHLPLDKLINRYSLVDGVMYARFLHSSDNFYLSFVPESNEVFIIGDQITLERVIVDFLSITARFLPLHAGCVRIGQKTFIIAGNSKTGKTSLILKLLGIGAEYISEEVLFSTDNQVARHGSYVSIRKDFLPVELYSLNFYRNSDSSVYLDTNDMKKVLGYKFGNQTVIDAVLFIYPLEYLKLNRFQLFPAVFRDSILCMEILGKHYRDIGEFIFKSKKYYTDLLKNAHTIHIDFSDFDNYVKKLYFGLDNNSNELTEVINV